MTRVQPATAICIKLDMGGHDHAWSYSNQRQDAEGSGCVCEDGAAAAETQWGVISDSIIIQWLDVT